MSVELSVATTNFMGDSYTFIDCPGSIEFIHDMRAALPAVDAAVVVCEADEKKIPQLQLVLRELEELKIPAFSVPQQDRQGRQARARDPEDAAAGLARAAAVAPDPDLEERHRHRLRRSRARARACLQGAHRLRGDRADRRGSRAREDRALHHAGDARRSRRRVDGAIAGGHSAAARQGVRRSRQGIARGPGLPGADRCRHPHQRRAAVAEGVAPRDAEYRGDGKAPRRRAQDGDEAVAYVLKTLNTAHGGKMSVARVLAGQVGDGITSQFARTRSRPRFRHVQDHGPDHRKARPRAGRRNGGARQARLCQDRRHARVGQDSRTSRWRRCRPIRRCSRSRSPPRSARTTSSSARHCNKMLEEDPSITVVHNADTHEVVLWGQGEMHLRVATERLAERFGIAIEKRQPSVGYRETIKKSIQQRGRHKKQSGGHGQFGDVVLDVKPLPRGTRLRVRREDHRRRGAAQLHPVGGGGRDRRIEAGSARLPGGRCRR